LLKLNDDWEVERVEWTTNRQMLRIEIKETPALLKGITCEKCGGALEVYGHEEPKLWSYPGAFDQQAEIECRLPLIRCKSCGQVPVKYPLKVPWEDKGRLIDGPRSATPVNLTVPELASVYLPGGPALEHFSWPSWEGRVGHLGSWVRASNKFIKPG
jgi:hypothetical protein